MLTVLLLFVAMLTGAEAKPKKPEPKLLCSPRVATNQPLSGALFAVKLRVTHPGERFWCPAVEWRVDGQFSGSHEGDCEPYDTVAAREGEPEVWGEDTRYIRLGPGDHTIEAVLSRAGKELAKPSCTVYVR